MARTVTTTPTSYNLAITITGGTAARTCSVTVKNRRTQEFKLVRSANNTAAVDLTNLTSDGQNPSANNTSSGYKEADVIDVFVSGGSFGATTHAVAIKSGGAKVSVATTDTSSTNTTGASI